MKLYLGSHEENVVLDVVDTGCDDGQCHTWENVSIITLTRVESLTLIGDGQERRATGENGFSLNGK